MIVTIFALEKYIVLFMPIMFVAIILLQAYRKRKKLTVETWYRKRTTKTQGFIIDFADEYDNWIISFYAIYICICIVVVMLCGNIGSAFVGRCYEASIGVTGIVATILSIAYTLDERSYLFFTIKDMLRSMRVGRRFFLIMITMIIVVIFSCIDMMNIWQNSYWVEDIIMFLFGINMFYNFIVVHMVYKVIFGGDSKEKDLLRMLYRVFDVETLEQKTIENIDNLVPIGKRNLTILVNDFFKQIDKIDIDALEDMELSISWETEDKTRRKRWIWKSIRSVLFFYIIICSICVLFYFSNNEFQIILLWKLIMIYCISFFFLSALASKVHCVQMQIISMTSGSYGYNVKYKAKERSIGINGTKINCLDRKFSRIIQARNSIIAMFWLLSQNVGCDDSRKLIEILVSVVDCFEKYKSDYVLLPLYLSEFFIWRSDKDNHENRLIFMDEYKDERIKKLMDTELYVLLRHVESNPQLYKEDLDEFFLHLSV